MMKNRRLSKKVVSVLTVAAMGMALLTGCGDSGKSSGTTAASSDDGGLIPVTIYGVTDPQEAAQIVIAKEKGYFEEEGLDVTNKLIESSSDLPAYIASGEAPVSRLQHRALSLRP